MVTNLVCSTQVGSNPTSSSGHVDELTSGPTNAIVTQSVEYHVANVTVAGSNPVYRS